MSYVVVRLLKAGQLPKPETLSKLNQRLAEWARGRENVQVVPPAAVVQHELVARRRIESDECVCDPARILERMQAAKPVEAGATVGK